MKRVIVYGLGDLICRISPTLASRYWFYFNFRRSLPLHNPVTLNEKLMWLKLNTYRNNPLISQCSDKYCVRDYIIRCGCEELLNELYGVWNSAEEIDWDTLPESFVLKCNHGCGYNILCPDKKQLDISETKALLTKWMRTAFWRKLAEVQYQSISPKIICEAFLGSGGQLYDYKFYCFHGKAEYVLVCTERGQGKPRFYFFNRDWELCPITRDGKRAEKDFQLQKPAHLDEMFQYAQRLAEPFPFVRVDLYSVEGKIYFGELTFIPSAALDTSRLPETDLLFGSMLKLPKD